MFGVYEKEYRLVIVYKGRTGQRKPIWNDSNINLSSKIKLMRPLVLSIFLYSCEIWTVSADLQSRIQAMEMRFFQKI